MEKVLVIKLSALGDVVQAEGAMHDIRLHHPQAEITVMTTPPYRRLLARCPWVDRILLDHRESRFRLDKMASLRSRLRREQFTMVYDLQQVSRTSFYFYWFLRSTPWMGGVRGCRYYCRRPPGRCAADHFRLGLQQAGVRVQHTLQCDVSWMADDVTEILERHGLRRDYVVLIPGASAAHPEKRWPGYHELAARLHAAGMRVVTVPGPDEMELCREIGGDMLTVAGTYLDYFQLAGVLKRAALVIGNDTGPTHIAAHLRIPGLALFSDHTPPQYTGIQHSRFRWLEKADLRQLSLATVWSEVERLLAEHTISGLENGQ